MREFKIIEGFGLPGSGKSTCIATLKNNPRVPESVKILLRKDADSKFLDKESTDFDSKGQIFVELYRSVTYLLLRPAFFLSVLQSVVIFRFSKSFISVLRSLITALDNRSTIKVVASNEQNILLDEGLIQYVGALAVNSSTNSTLPERLIRNVLFHNIQALIYFDIDFASAILRIKKRNDGKSRFDRMNDESAILNLKKMQQTFALCIKIAHDLNIPVLELKNGNSIEQNTELTLNFLNELF